MFDISGNFSSNTKNATFHSFCLRVPYIKSNKSMTLFVQPKYPRYKTNKNPIAKGATICKPFRIMLILMFTIYGINMSCRAQTNTDSLWTVWQDSSQHDTLRLDAIYNYAWDGYLFANPDSAFYFAQLQYNYAENKGHKKWMANALYTQGVAHYLNGKYTEALECYNQSLTIREEITDLKGIAVTLNGLGLIKEERGYHAEAIAHYMRSLKILEELGDKSRMAGIMNNIGIIYLTQGDDQQALVFYNRSLKIHEELNDKESTANALNNIGIIHKNNEDYELALEYYNRSLQLGEESGDQRGLSNSLINIGNVYVLQGDFSQALDYFNRSLKIKEEVGDKKGMAMSLIGLAEVYNEQKNYTKAIATAQKALSISQELGLAEVLREAANTLYQSYKANGNNRLSLEMYELYIATRDSLVSEENQREVIRYQYKSDYEKQYLTDSLNFARNEAIKNLELKKSENLKGFFIVASVLTFLLALFAYYGYRQKQKANIMLEERNKFEIENKKEPSVYLGNRFPKR